MLAEKSALKIFEFFNRIGQKQPVTLSRKRTLNVVLNGGAHLQTHASLLAEDPSLSHSTAIQSNHALMITRNSDSPKTGQTRISTGRCFAYA